MELVLAAEDVPPGAHLENSREWDGIRRNVRRDVCQLAPKGCRREPVRRERLQRFAADVVDTQEFAEHTQQGAFPVGALTDEKKRHLVWIAILQRVPEQHLKCLACDLVRLDL